MGPPDFPQFLFTTAAGVEKAGTTPWELSGESLILDLKSDR